MLQKGDKLPDIVLKDADGKDVRLTDFIGKPLVVFFYPKDNTRVCTAQACGFRDHFDEYLAYDANIIGISKDSPESHGKVMTKRKLPFPLLSDPKGRAVKAFGVSSYLFTLQIKCSLADYVDELLRCLFLTRPREESLRAGKWR